MFLDGYSLISKLLAATNAGYVQWQTRNPHTSFETTFILSPVTVCIVVIEFNNGHPRAALMPQSGAGEHVICEFHNSPTEQRPSDAFDNAISELYKAIEAQAYERAHSAASAIVAELDRFLADLS